ncbi:D-sedoheptulose 7-phosphate isomerase [Azospirillaceae bacterium]
METDFSAYFATIARLGQSVAVTDRQGGPVAVGDGVSRVQRLAVAAHAGGGKLMFIGNGGSAGIASHCAIDYAKNGGLRALAFNDGAALTCLGNDYGFESVFAKQMEFHARPGDLLIAISSSGNSPDIRSAVTAVQERGGTAVTLSGFEPGNALRTMGELNFYVASAVYGLVEIVHLALCHAILDLHMGWRAPDRHVGPA